MFLPFDNSVETDYGSPGLCGVWYYIYGPVSDPTLNYGVSVDTAGLKINVQTFDSSLIGSSVQFLLFAKATPVQDTPSDQLSFQVSVLDPCPSTILDGWNPAAPTDMFHTVTGLLTSQVILATHSVSTSTGIPTICGPIAYTYTPTLPFVNFVANSLEV